VGVPPILATNLVLNVEDPRDDGLAALVSDGTLLQTHVVERGGLRFGLIGVLGTDAYEKMGQADPVSISDPTEAARQAAIRLRADGSDVVVLLSHSGVWQEDGEYVGFEVDYVRDIPEIDAVVGGHSHTPIHEPPVIEGRPVLQAGSDGRFLGEAVFTQTGDRWAMESSVLHPVDDRTLGDTLVTEMIHSAQQQISTELLAPLGLTFDAQIAEVDRDLTRSFDDYALGNLVTDAYREAVGADIGFTGNGMIRADLVKGTTGVQQVSDVFRVDPVGIGTHDDRPGYGLVKMWFSGKDLKSVLEFLLVGYTLKGKDYYPRISGVQVTYNPRRVPMDQIMEVAIGDDAKGYLPVDLSSDAMYSVATTTYIAGFMPTISESTYGILHATPRDAKGNPVEDLDTLVWDSDPETLGIDELKGWRVLIDHVAGLPDTNGDGLPNVDTTGPLGDRRLIAKPSLSPGALTAMATWRQWLALLVPPGLVGLFVTFVGLLVRRIRS
jgi:5'-nucleotidase